MLGFYKILNLFLFFQILKNRKGYKEPYINYLSL